jgi:hypothetical protein
MKNNSELKCGSVKAAERISAFLVGAALALCLTTSNRAAAQGPEALAPLNLGSAGNFVVLAYAGVTNTGPSVVVEDLGTYPIRRGRIL